MTLLMDDQCLEIDVRLLKGVDSLTSGFSSIDESNIFTFTSPPAQITARSTDLILNSCSQNLHSQCIIIGIIIVILMII